MPFIFRPLGRTAHLSPRTFSCPHVGPLVQNRLVKSLTTILKHCTPPRLHNKLIHTKVLAVLHGELLGGQPSSEKPHEGMPYLRKEPWDGNHPSSLPLSPTEIESHIIKQEDILNGKENEIKELQQVISQQKQIFR